MSENNIDYNKKRQEYENYSKKKIVEILENTNNKEFNNFIVGEQSNFNYSEDKQKLDDLNEKLKSKTKEFNNCKRLYQENLKRAKNTSNAEVKEDTNTNTLTKKELQNKQAELKVLQREIEKEKQAFETKYNYAEYVKQFSVSDKNNLKDLPARIKEKNNDTTERLLFLLKTNTNGFRDKVIPEKNEALKTNPYEYENYFVETLSKDNIEQILLLGAIVPCCLSLNESGNKYLLAALFNPNVSITVVKDKDNKIVSTALTVYNEKTNTVNFVHIDVVRNANVNKESLRNVFEGYSRSIIEENQDRNVLILPGEQTLFNLGYDNIVEFENYLYNLIETHNPEQLQVIKKFEKSAKQNRRTGSATPCIGFVLENIELFDETIKDSVLTYLKNITKKEVYCSNPNAFLFSDDSQDRFHISDSFGGHSISQFAFNVGSQLDKSKSATTTENTEQNRIYQKLVNLTNEFNDIDKNIEDYNDLSLQNESIKFELASCKECEKSLAETIIEQNANIAEFK